MSSYKLYIFLRSDLESLSPGKASAQCAHAATQHALFYSGSEEFNEWAGDRGFGTTIVLDGGSFDVPELDMYLDVENDDFVIESNGELIDLRASMVTDTSYPIRDGKITHEVNINTCYWIFVDPDDLTEIQRNWLKSFKLYNGNHD
jgi:hypothetical protein